jgi:2-alkyl-3-oxoalkanoate reductase
VNLIDDALPTQHVYINQLLARLATPPRTLALDWTVMQGLAQLLWQTNRWLFAGRLKLPGLLIPARLHARFKPLQYSNLHAKQILAWTPAYSFEAALDRIFGSTDLLAVSLDSSSSSSSVHSS